MGTGLTENGYEIKRQPEIVEEIEEDQKTAFGSDLILDPSSPDAQLNGLLSNQLAKLWQNGLDIYSGLDPRTANGIMLDRISAIAGLDRKQETSSIATVDLSGSVGAVIPENTIFSAPDIPNVKFSLDSEITLDAQGVGIGEVTSDTLGATLIAPNSITKIDTPVSGLNTVNNENAGQSGTDQETDEELRTRRAYSLSLGSVSMINSIISAVANVDGVDRAKLYENSTEVVDAHGLTPHSIMQIVRGGSDTDIAIAIADNRSVGSGMNGDVLVSYTDKNDFDHNIRFSRPTEVPIFVQITATKLQNWDIYTDEIIKNLIVGYGNGTDGIYCGDFLGYQISEDVYGSQFIYSLVSVTEIIVKEILVKSSDPADQQLQTIEFDELATFSTENIEIIYV